MRPQSFEEYQGQYKIKKKLEITIQACQIRGTPLPHILLVGRPGLGKTSLSYVISKEMEAEFIECVGSSLKNDEDIGNVLKNLSEEKLNLLFIDEIHSMPKYTEEKFYQLLEDNKIELTIHETSIYTLPPLTVLGATTKVGSLTKPFIDRFGLQFELDDYSLTELGYIIAGVAAKSGVKIDGESAINIAKRSRGTPRIAVNLTQRCIDMAVVYGLSAVTEEIVEKTMVLYDIDEIGLTPRDYKFLKVLSESDKPLGVNSLASILGEDKATIESVIEPYLVQQELVVKTSRGRDITTQGLEYLGVAWE